MKKLLFLILALATQAAFAQNAPNKEITLEDIWAKFAFYPKGIDGFNFLNDGRHFTRQEEADIKEYDIETNAATSTIFSLADFNTGDVPKAIDDYSFSSDERKILLQTGTEKIYRHSYKASFYIYDRDKKELKPLSANGKQQYAMFSPDGSKVAFCRSNNLFYKDLKDGKEYQVTIDGKTNSIINGSTDWVYEEEFAFTRAFDWSSDGKKLAYMRFDETEVKEFTMDYYRNTLYPEPYKFKYPKAGEKNAVLEVYIYDLDKNKKAKTPKPVKVDLGNSEFYVPRLKWTRDPNLLCVTRMNRHQNELELLLANAASGSTYVLLREENKYYVDVTDNLNFFEDGKRFIWTSEKDGYNHIYLYDLSGKLVNQVTKGKWEVSSFYGVDEKNGVVYYQSTEESPLERYIYSIKLDGSDKKRLTMKKGTNTAQFSSTFAYYILTHSSLTTPPAYSVHKSDGKELRVLEDNAELSKLVASYSINMPEFFSLTTSENVQLNGWMIKPYGFDASKKYPVFMYLYGGPGSQEVTDEWDSFNRMWMQSLAQKGYIIACVDNRGTGGRGEEFKKMTYLQLGKYETMDQIEAAKWLGKQSYVDASRIGIWGWSYGGYMSSLCLLKGNDVFKMAIAVAPVTNWKWYDSIYTERYMRTPKENNSGYEDNSPVNFADRLKGKYLLIHGMTDDNVHFQNSVEMDNALILKQKQFDCYFYPNSNHGIGGGAKRMHLYRKMTDFVLENL